jgi:D-alanyl-D-alanine carboxypeptidase/D-alanyl-D-alanine-endopeptidase (penicillin-binding protein 4)
LKVSHNLGANLSVCLMAVANGSHDCFAGFAVRKAFLERAGVDTAQVQLLDGRGGNPVDRATPTAEVQILEYWLRTRNAVRFRRAPPILGVDGDLGLVCRHSRARGNVFAKTGTVRGLDAVTASQSAPRRSRVTSPSATAATTCSSSASTTRLYAPLTA